MQKGAGCPAPEFRFAKALGRLDGVDAVDDPLRLGAERRVGSGIELRLVRGRELTQELLEVAELGDGVGVLALVELACGTVDLADRAGEVLRVPEGALGGDGVRFEEIGPVALKGVREELTLYAASRA